MKLKVSLGQMDIALGEPEKNLDKMRAMTAEAQRRGSEVVVFPELWSTGYDLERVREYATPIDEGVFAETAKIAKENSIHIIGSLLSTADRGYTNTAAIFSPQGHSLGEYSKVHLFDPMEEPKYLVPGQEATVFDLAWGKSALAICYDLRFPELFRKYALAGARVVFLTAEWPYPRLTHWQILLRARAIENQFFIVACNRVGESGQWRFFGHSAVYDPSGELIVDADEEETLATAVIDLDAVDEARQAMPVLEDRREEVYSGEWPANQ
ncbi:MAG: carbon-nitrogen family hydrolase [Anaerolineae bacterium]|nr:carbon-nitrogen family hydrolase [Anaerolineae bacterium]NIN95020.1 carbon-nitrogen family hydrolase [Anaerolineae bacterium]NIQ78059.1 carbon-nitrogen family hydrolase [Anaerolineae bacterium]